MAHTSPMPQSPLKAGSATIAFDASNRQLDPENGYLRVADCVLSRESVDPYYGYEVPGWELLGLEADAVYYVYRPASELEKAVPTFNGLPLLVGHQADSAMAPQKDVRAGAVMNDVRMAGGDMIGSISVMDAEAVNGIESGNRVCLSSAYTYVPVAQCGEWQGVPYGIRMTEIHGNHVALVEEGRVKGAVVADEKPKRGRIMDIIDGLKRILSEADADKDENRPETPQEQGVDSENAPGMGAAEQELRALIAEMEDAELAGRLMALVDAIRQDDRETDPQHDETDEEKRLGAAAESVAPTGDARPGTGSKTNRSPVAVMDAAVIARDAKRAALEEIRAIHEAARDVRSIVGDVDPFNMTGADQVYKMALESQGIRAADYPASAWRGMAHALKTKTESALARDWNVDSGPAYDALPEHLKNTKVRG